MRYLNLILVVLVMAALSLGTAAADSGYSLAWFSLDGGGYTLSGGFWAGVTSQLPDQGNTERTVFLPLVGR